MASAEGTAFPYLARTTLKYKSPHATDLSFAKDETIRVTGPSADDEDWLVGEILDGSKSGGFPKDFIVPIEEESAPTEAPASTPMAAPVPPPAQSDSPLPKDATAPPSPVMEKATLLPSIAPSPAPPAPAPATQTEDGAEPAKQSMKERLAFFAAAQNKVAPPPPIKPKPSAGGLTWSQRQKMRQEQEAKEAESGGAPVPAAAAPIPTATPVSSAPTASPSVDDQAKADAGLSAADAQSSIGKGGSLKERMAALRGAGAFGAPEAKVAPSPPAKPTGKVWSRPAAPEPQPGDEDEAEAGETEEIKPAVEGEETEETEETEEEQEKARRAAIAARMAKLGTRGPMGMPPPAPPKPTRKPTSDSLSSPVAEKSESIPTPFTESAVPSTESPETGSSPTSVISPPTSVAMPAIPRRTAGPRRAARPAAPKAEVDDAESRLEKVHPDGTISPPPAVMVANEEDPIPRSTEQLEAEKQNVEAGKGPAGVQGAQAAGIALAPVSRSAGQTEETQAAESDDEGDAPGLQPQAPVMVPMHSPAPSGPPTDIDSDNDDQVPQSTSHSASRGILGLPKDEIELKHEHDAALAQQEGADEEEEEEDDVPPPPPQRLADKPTGPRPLPSTPSVGSALPPPPTRSVIPHPADEDEEDDEEEDEEAPPPPPARQPSMPLPPRPMPPADDEEEEDDDESPPPPPPVRRPTLPPPPVSQPDDEEEDAEVKEDDAPPPPPRREPSMSAPSRAPPSAISTDIQAPLPPSSSSPTIATSPIQSKSLDTPIDAESTNDDDEAARRQGIAARMAKLGGIKFGVPPPVPKVKRTMTSDDIQPSSPGLSQAPPPIPSATTDSPSSPITARALPVREASFVAENNASDETPEEESERRRKTLARLRAGGTLGYGMFGQAHGGAQAGEDQRGIEETPEEDGAGDMVAETPPTPITARSPPSESVIPVQEEDDGPPPPPPAGRPPIPSNRPMPPIPGYVGVDEDEAPPPPPPARPARTLTSDVPQSPIRSSSTRNIEVAPPLGQAVLGSQTMDEPTEIPRSPERPSRPPPIQTPSQNQTPQQTIPSPTARRSMSIASRQSFQSNRSPSSPTVNRSDSMQGPISAIDGGRPSFQGARPGFNELQAASQDAGVRVMRAAQGLSAQGKKAFVGDGSPAGFIAVVYEQAKLPRPEQSWGQLIYEQDAGSVMKKYDEARVGDIAAFYDAKFKGKKGLTSYNQHVGSVEDPLLGVIVEAEQKKHKLRVIQVERGVMEEVSYRCDDLKSGRILVFRPGM